MKTCKKIIITAFSLAAVLTCSSFMPSLTNYEIIVPSVESVICNGYPKNNMGQTYGPDIGVDHPDDVFDFPDLLLAENQDGIIGYIKLEDINNTPTTIEEALEITIHPSTTEIPMYLHDGVTVVGSFSLTPHSQFERG